jgi:hypothetical protein
MPERDKKPGCQQEDEKRAFETPEEETFKLTHKGKKESKGLKKRMV